MLLPGMWGASTGAPVSGEGTHVACLIPIWAAAGLLGWPPFREALREARSSSLWVCRRSQEAAASVRRWCVLPCVLVLPHWPACGQHNPESCSHSSSSEDSSGDLPLPPPDCMSPGGSFHFVSAPLFSFCGGSIFKICLGR